MNNYCTYFDKNYVVRALALFDSLSSVDREHRIFALCLDEESLSIIELLGRNNITAIPLKDLEKFDPKLAETAYNRSLIEYYFTITPCLPLFLFSTYTEIEQLTYLDADLFFFSSPTPVFDEIGIASVALTPHNFSPDHIQDLAYGKFNMGWVSWRNDKRGLNALKWYRDRCIEWCYDRIEGNKFADQKYLEEIAGFPGAVEITNIGVNISEWCCNNYEIDLIDNTPTVNSIPVICYHFQQLWQNEPNKFDCVLPERHKTPDSILMTHMIQPYGEKLSYFLELVRKINPEINLRKINRGNTFQVISSQIQKLAIGSKKTNEQGWNTQKHITARIEQWDTFQGQLQSYLPFLSRSWDHHLYITFGYVLGLVAQHRSKISILDWGGAFGHHYLFAKRLFPELNIEYYCKEVPIICEYGKLVNKDIIFFDNDKEALSKKYDLILLNSSLQYSESWMIALRNLAPATEHWMLLLRVYLSNQRNSQRYTERAYGNEVDAWLISRYEFLLTCDELGLVNRQEMMSLESHQTPEGEIAGRCFLLEKKPKIVS